jgi:hypothetical protein
MPGAHDLILTFTVQTAEGLVCEESGLNRGPGSELHDKRGQAGSHGIIFNQSFDNNGNGHNALLFFEMTINDD